MRPKRVRSKKQLENTRFKSIKLENIKTRLKNVKIRFRTIKLKNIKFQKSFLKDNKVRYL